MKEFDIHTSEDDILTLEDGDVTLLDDDLESDCDDLESLDFETISGETIDNGLIRNIEELQEINKRVDEIFKTIERIEALEGVEKTGLSFQLASQAAVKVDLLRFRLRIGLREISQRLSCSEEQLKKIQKPSIDEIKRREEEAESLKEVRKRWQLEDIKNTKGERIGIRAKPKDNLFLMTPEERDKSNLIPFPEIKSKAIKQRAAGEK